MNFAYHIGMGRLADAIHYAIEDCRWRGAPLGEAVAGEAVRMFNSRAADGTHLSMQIPDPHFHQRALQVEEKLGLSGIAGRYVLPEGLSAREIQSYATIARQQTLRGETTPQQEAQRTGALWAAVAKENPQLSTLVFDRKDPDKLHDALVGVARAFNTDDIQHYLDGGTRGAAIEEPVYVALFGKVFRDFSGGMTGWTPALSTLKEMDRQMGVRVAPVAETIKSPSPPTWGRGSG